MNERHAKAKVIALYRDKAAIEKKIEKYQIELTRQLCPKGKQECEPEYCVFRLADTCPFLKEWWAILEEAGVPRTGEYDLLVDFVQRMLEDKRIIDRNESPLE